MSVRLYMDVHVPVAITSALRLRSVDVLTAQEDGAAELTDSELLSRSSRLSPVLVTQDSDLLREAARRRQSRETFHGVVYSHQLDISIGRCVLDLELIARASEAREWINWVEYLPL